MKVFSMTKYVKKTFFGKTCYILSNNVPIIFLGGLIQAPNMSKHISRNGGATIKASRKTAYDKVFYLGAERPFFPNKMVAPWKKL